MLKASGPIRIIRIINMQIIAYQQSHVISSLSVSCPWMVDSSSPLSRDTLACDSLHLMLAFTANLCVTDHDLHFGILHWLNIKDLWNFLQMYLVKHKTTGEKQHSNQHYFMREATLNIRWCLITRCLYHGVFISKTQFNPLKLHVHVYLSDFSYFNKVISDCW